MLIGTPIRHLFLRFWPMMFCIILGTISGVKFLAQISTIWSGLVLGIALLIYAIYSLLSPNLFIARRLEKN